MNIFYIFNFNTFNILYNLHKAKNCIGAETLGVVQNTLIAKWFIGAELSLALGIDISVGRFGGVMNNYITPPLAEATSLGVALMLGFFLCIVSLISAIITVIFETRAIKIDKQIESESPNEEKEEFNWRNIRELSWSFWFISFFWGLIYI